MPSSAFNNRKAVQISTGYYFSIVVLDDGTCFTFGKQEMTNKNSGSCLNPELVIFPKDVFVKNAICGGFHAIFLVEDHHGSNLN